MSDCVFGLFCVVAAIIILCLGVFSLLGSLLFLFAGPEGPRVPDWSRFSGELGAAGICFAGLGLGLVATSVFVARLGIKYLKQKNEH
jgi:hypothetical protein